MSRVILHDPKLAANRVLAWLVDHAGGSATHRQICAGCGLDSRGGVASATRMLERCGWVNVREPANYVSDRARRARSEMVVTVTPAGRIWRSYVHRHHMEPRSRIETFTRMLALEDAVRPLALLGIVARERGLGESAEVDTCLPVSALLLAAEIIHGPEDGARLTVYPWTQERREMRNVHTEEAGPDRSGGAPGRGDSLRDDPTAPRAPDRRSLPDGEPPDGGWRGGLESGGPR